MIKRLLPLSLVVLTITLLINSCAWVNYLNKMKQKRRGELITCDKFDIICDLKGGSLSLSLDTDLPDFTEIRVSIDRQYSKRAVDKAFYIEYFSEKSTVEDYRSLKTVLLDNSEWEESLNRAKKIASSVKKGFIISDINDDIRVQIMVTMLQKNEVFGKNNENLEGRKVEKQDKFNVVEEDFFIEYPLNEPMRKRLVPDIKYSGKKSVKNTEKKPAVKKIINTDRLQEGKTYRISDRTRMLILASTGDNMDGNKQEVRLRKGSLIKVIQIKEKDYFPWYKIIAKDRDKKEIGMGWITSNSLAGQDLKVVE